MDVSVAEARRIQLRLRERRVDRPPAGFAPRLVAGADLSIRRAPLLEAWRRLERAPDAVIFDGHGTAHPRRFGLACHGGLLLDLPAVGCAKSLLVGEHGELGPERGSTAGIRHEGETVGVALRTRSRVRPVYVSVGHRMDLEAAVDLVLSVSPRYRVPEPVRAADRLVDRLRREAGPAAVTLRAGRSFPPGSGRRPGTPAPGREREKPPCGTESGDSSPRSGSPP